MCPNEPDAENMSGLAVWSYEDSPNCVGLALRNARAWLSGLIEMLNPKVSLECLPFVGGVAERREEACFEPAHRMACREQIPVELHRVDLCKVRVRQQHEEILPSSERRAYSPMPNDRLQPRRRQVISSAAVGCKPRLGLVDRSKFYPLRRPAFVADCHVEVLHAKRSQQVRIKGNLGEVVAVNIQMMIGWPGHH